MSSASVFSKNGSFQSQSITNVDDLTCDFEMEIGALETFEDIHVDDSERNRNTTCDFGLDIDGPETSEQDIHVDDSERNRNNCEIGMDIDGPETSKQDIHVGSKFSSFADVECAIANLEKTTFTKYYKRDSRKIEAARMKIFHPIDPSLIYYDVKYACIRGGKKIRKQGRGIRENTSTFQNECPVHITFRVTRDGKYLEVKSLNNLHNHETSKVMYAHLPHERCLPNTVKESARDLLKLKCNKKLLQKKLQDETGKVVTLKDLSNIAQSSNKEQERNLVNGIHLLKDRYDADVEIYKDTENNFLGIFFQTKMMKSTMAAFPEFLALDGTYKLLDINVPVFIFLVEDSCCQSEVVAVCILVNEDKKSLQWMLSTFRKKNPSSSLTRSIMTDKDLNERQVLKETFPSSKLLLCVFHTLRSFSREVSCEKLGITQAERMSCLEIFQQMIFSRSEETFNQHLESLKAIAPKQVLNYYYSNWHKIRDDWYLGREFHSSNFLNSTNNRVEVLNSKLKSVITRHSTLQDFLEKLFSVIATLENEKDHVAIMSALKNPLIMEDKNSDVYKYTTLLTKPVAKYVKHQLVQAQNVLISLPDEVDGNYCTKDPVEGQINTSIKSCSCNFHRSMLLPCKHIFAIRKLLGMPLYDESLCNRRWTQSYYFSCQRKFFTATNICSIEQSSTNVTVKKPSKPKSVGEKRRAAIAVANNLCDVLSMCNTQTFVKRLKMLKTIQSYWESDIDFSIIPTEKNFPIQTDIAEIDRSVTLDIDLSCQSSEMHHRTESLQGNDEDPSCQNAESSKGSPVIPADTNIPIIGNSPMERDIDQSVFTQTLDKDLLCQSSVEKPHSTETCQDTDNSFHENVGGELCNAVQNVNTDLPNAELTKIKMPKVLKKRGRPKGHDLTVIGLPIKKKNYNKPKPFILLPNEEKKAYMLNWWLGKEAADKVKEQNIVFDVNSLENLADIPFEFLDPHVDINLIKNHFSTDGFKEINRRIVNLKNMSKWKCNACLNELDKHPSIVCDSCLKWYHTLCVGLRKSPKARYWCCRKCHRKL